MSLSLRLGRFPGLSIPSLDDTLNLYTPNLPIDPYAALGGVVSIHPSHAVSLRYGVFNLSTTYPIARWISSFPDKIPDGSGIAQFLQVNVEPSSWAPTASTPITACRTGAGIVRRQGSCSTPVQVQNQLPGGLLSFGGFLTSNDGNGVYGTVTLRSGLSLGLDERV